MSSSCRAFRHKDLRLGVPASRVCRGWYAGLTMMRRHSSRSSFVLLGLLLGPLLSLLLGAPLEAQAAAASRSLTPAERGEAIAELDPRYKDWIRSVLGLITEPELDYFLTLGQDFRRDAFMEAFWGPRDPDPQTPQNELRERWEEYRATSNGLPFGDPRFLLALLNGPPTGWSLPDGRYVTRCFSKTRELEIWYYDGSPRTSKRFAVIFQRRAPAVPYELFLPGGAIRPISRSRLPVTDIRLLCADELLGYTIREVSLLANYDGLLEEAIRPPIPSPEWLDTFSASAADLPEGAETFPVEAEISFPERKQSRTGVRVMLVAPRSEAPGKIFDGVAFHHFRLIGEVIRDGALFESFRYTYEGPTPGEASAVPLGLTRFLRPGPATLRLLLEDVYGKRYAHVVRELDVPSPDGLPATAGPSRADELFPEGPSVRLVPPPGVVQTGLVRFRAQAWGEEVAKVAFFLDDEQILAKRRPPYSAELDLGPEAAPRRVRAVAFDAEGREIATDQLWLNQGALRFRARLVEPRPGGIYPGSVNVRVEVDTPSGDPPARVELFLNDDPVATLGAPPFTHPLVLDGDGTAVVRTVAHLGDGTTAEDAVVINSTGFIETVDVRLVELPVLVRDAAGRPIAGLERGNFRVLEDGVERPVERFEVLRDAPLRAALLIDRSSSMAPHLDTVQGAARAFAGAALTTPDDRLAVLSFAADLTIDAPFTRDSAELERALLGLEARGETALWDALAQGFQSTENTSGASALILFTDGRDASSELSREQIVDLARRFETILYTVGLEASFPEAATRRALTDLAAETGGRAIFLDSLTALDTVYSDILTELRARYLLAYPMPEGDDGYREVEVTVDVPGADVKTRAGYRP